MDSLSLSPTQIKPTMAFFINIYIYLCNNVIKFVIIF